LPRSRRRLHGQAACLTSHEASYFRSLWERRAIFRRKRVQRCEIVLNRANCSERVRLGQRIGPKKETQLYEVRWSSGRLK
jgi:hypothetical protein